MPDTVDKNTTTCSLCGGTRLITVRVDGEVTCPECGYGPEAQRSVSEPEPILVRPARMAPADSLRLLGLDKETACGWIALVPCGQYVPYWADSDITAKDQNENVLTCFQPDSTGYSGAPIEVWSFHEAPSWVSEIAGHPNGGDEDWVAKLPPGCKVPMWMEAPSEFAHCDTSEYPLQDGGTLVVSGHS